MDLVVFYAFHLDFFFEIVVFVFSVFDRKE